MKTKIEIRGNSIKVTGNKNSLVAKILSKAKRVNIKSPLLGKRKLSIQKEE